MCKRADRWCIRILIAETTPTGLAGPGAATFTASVHQGVLVVDFDAGETLRCGTGFAAGQMTGWKACPTMSLQRRPRALPVSRLTSFGTSYRTPGRGSCGWTCRLHQRRRDNLPPSTGAIRGFKKAPEAPLGGDAGVAFQRQRDGDDYRAARMRGTIEAVRLAHGSD